MKNNDRKSIVTRKLSASQCRELIIEALAARGVDVASVSDFLLRGDPPGFYGLEVDCWDPIVLPGEAHGK